MNTMLTNLYANSKGNLTKEALQQNAGELVVDISSDESDSDGTSNKHSAGTRIFFSFNVVLFHYFVLSNGHFDMLQNPISQTVSPKYPSYGYLRI